MCDGFDVFDVCVIEGVFEVLMWDDGAGMSERDAARRAKKACALICEVE